MRAPLDGRLASLNGGSRPPWEAARQLRPPRSCGCGSRAVQARCARTGGIKLPVCPARLPHCLRPGNPVRTAPPLRLRCGRVGWQGCLPGARTRRPCLSLPFSLRPAETARAGIRKLPDPASSQPPRLEPAAGVRNGGIGEPHWCLHGRRASSAAKRLPPGLQCPGGVTATLTPVHCRPSLCLRPARSPPRSCLTCGAVRVCPDAHDPGQEQSGADAGSPLDHRCGTPHVRAGTKLTRGQVQPPAVRSTALPGPQSQGPEALRCGPGTSRSIPLRSCSRLRASSNLLSVATSASALSAVRSALLRSRRSDSFSRSAADTRRSATVALSSVSVWDVRNRFPL